MFDVRDFVKAIMVKPGDRSFNIDFIDFIAEGVKTGIITLDDLKAISVEADEQIERGGYSHRWKVFSDELRPRFLKWPRFSKDNKEPPPTQEECARILKELDNQPFRRSDGPGSRIPGKPQGGRYDFNRLDEYARNRFKDRSYSFFREIGRMEEIRVEGKLSVEQGNQNRCVGWLSRTRQCCLVMINVIDSIFSEIEPARIQEPMEPVEDITNDDPLRLFNNYNYSETPRDYTEIDNGWTEEDKTDESEDEQGDPPF